MRYHDDTKTPADRRRAQVKPWWLIATVGCLLSGLVLSLAAVNSAAYHWRQYEWLKTRGKAMTHPNLLEEAEERLLGNISDRLYSHVEALEGIGEVNAHVFRATYVDLPRGIMSDLHKQSRWYQTVQQGRISGELLASRGIIEPMGSGSQITMTVWCRSEFSEKWGKLAAEFDARRNEFDRFVEEPE